MLFRSRFFYTYECIAFLFEAKPKSNQRLLREPLPLENQPVRQRARLTAPLAARERKHSVCMTNAACRGIPRTPMPPSGGKKWQSAAERSAHGQTPQGCVPLRSHDGERTLQAGRAMPRVRPVDQQLYSKLLGWHTDTSTRTHGDQGAVYRNQPHRQQH